MGHPATSTSTHSTSGTRTVLAFLVWALLGLFGGHRLYDIVHMPPLGAGHKGSSPSPYAREHQPGGLKSRARAPVRTYSAVSVQCLAVLSRTMCPPLV